MDPATVQLIGVFDPEGKKEAFLYSVNAPINFWIGALCSDGSRMSMDYMHHFVNELIRQDKFGIGDYVDSTNQAGVKLRATVMADIHGDDVEAFQCETPYVRPINVKVMREEDLVDESV